MKIVRFERDGKLYYGAIHEDRVVALGGNVYDKVVPTSRDFPLKKVNLKIPILPGKIICLGLNYTDHAEEMGVPMPEEPEVFFKPQTSVIGNHDPIVCPKESQMVHYEAELGIVIRKKTYRVKQDKALDHILGYICLNDVTARDLQAKANQWGRAKGFDTFCPIGPCVETELDTSDIKVQALLNDKVVQDSTTANMFFKVPQIIEFLSAGMTLMPGDIIATGTPPGVGRIKKGDKIVIRIEGIGDLVNPVK